MKKKEIKGMNKCILERVIVSASNFVHSLWHIMAAVAYYISLFFFSSLLI